MTKQKSQNLLCVGCDAELNDVFSGKYNACSLNSEICEKYPAA